MSKASNTALDSNDHLVKAHNLVREVVQHFRRIGLNRDRALVAAAEQLEISRDLTWRLNYCQKIMAVPRWRLDALERRFTAHLDEQIAEAERHAEALRVRKQQRELMLTGGAGCADSGGNYSRSSPRDNAWHRMTTSAPKCGEAA